jgi:hypothetical protein
MGKIEAEEFGVWLVVDAMVLWLRVRRFFSKYLKII